MCSEEGIVEAAALRLESVRLHSLDEDRLSALCMSGFEVL